MATDDTAPAAPTPAAAPGRRVPVGVKRSLPTTALGMATLLFFMSIACAFTGAILYAYYDYRLGQTDARISTFETGLRVGAEQGARTDRQRARPRRRPGQEPAQRPREVRGERRHAHRGPRQGQAVGVVRADPRRGRPALGRLRLRGLLRQPAVVPAHLVHHGPGRHDQARARHHAEEGHRHDDRHAHVVGSGQRHGAAHGEPPQPPRAGVGAGQPGRRRSATACSSSRGSAAPAARSPRASWPACPPRASSTTPRSGAAFQGGPLLNSAGQVLGGGQPQLRAGRVLPRGGVLRGAHPELVRQGHQVPAAARPSPAEPIGLTTPGRGGRLRSPRPRRRGRRGRRGQRRGRHPGIRLRRVHHVGRPPALGSSGSWWDPGAKPPRWCSFAASGTDWMGAGSVNLVIGHVLQRGGHERLPDPGRVGAAGDDPDALDVLQHLRLGPGGVLVAHPHRGRQGGRVADEPGVLAVLGGAGLAGGGPVAQAAAGGRARLRARPGGCR